MDTRQLATSDGHSITADISRPDGVARGSVVVCHPHPQYGGNRFNPVVEAVFSRLPAAGFVGLRFDFRQEFGGGEAEVLDVIAALDHAVEESPDAPLALVGYSFGAAVALRTDDERIAAVAAIAPPLAMMSAPEPRVPTLVLTPQHDQFSDPAATGPVVGAWNTATFEVIESADHFLAGSAGKVGERVCEWLTASI